MNQEQPRKKKRVTLFGFEGASEGTETLTKGSQGLLCVPDSHLPLAVASAVFVSHSSWPQAL